MRASALVRGADGAAILIDAGPEFRLQALRSGIDRLDAVLVTHTHADHIHGLDDIRIFTKNRTMPLFAAPWCIDEIRERFRYIFEDGQEGGGKPHIQLVGVHAPFTVAGIEVFPVPLTHGSIPILGWRIGDTAYLTDCNAIPESSYEMLSGVRNVVIDALRARPHTTHFSFSQALDAIRRIDPERAWFTHICHDFSDSGIREWLGENGRDLAARGKKIEPAHDGLRFAIGR